jgi:hypothetical protein
MTAQQDFVIRLRRHRERSRISIEEIAIGSRIKPELIDAFERNDLSEWPRGLYARSWVRVYAGLVGLDPTDTVDEFCRLFPHGDRRTAGTLQGVAAIVAHPSEYRDEFSHSPDRRGRTSAIEMPTNPAWQSAIARAAQLVWTRIVTLKPSLTPRLKGTPWTP